MAKITALNSHRRLATRTTALPEDLAAGTRGAILDAALHLFAENSYGGTSVRDLCSRADVQPTTLYSYFPSKEAVLAEIIRLGHEAHHRQLRNALLTAQPDPVAQIVVLVDAHVRVHCEFSMLSVVANAELHSLSEIAATAALTIRKQSEALFAEIIARGVRSGAFNTPDPMLAMTAIGGMGLRVAHWYSPDCGKTVDEIARGYCDITLRILGVRDTK